MFKGRGNHVAFALLLPCRGGGQNGLIVGFAAAGGEGDLVSLGAQAAGHGFPGLLQGGGCRLSKAVGAGGVAVDLVQIRQHGGLGRRAHGGGGRVVSVNSQHLYIPRFYNTRVGKFFFPFIPICFMRLYYTIFFPLSR